MIKRMSASMGIDPEEMIEEIMEKFAVGRDATRRK